MTSCRSLQSFILIQVYLVYTQHSFQDIIFPPAFVDSLDPKSPPGHLKPLGSQRPADGPVIEYDHILSTQEYWDKHVKSRTPCVFRQAINKSQALSKWTDEYLNAKYGDLDVLVELKKENRTFSTGRLRFSEFLRRYKKDDLYIVTMLPKAMMHEVQAINSVLCGTFKNFTHESNFWMSNGGTRSVIHYDADHNLHCMIAGRKDLIMVKNTQQNRKWLYMSSKPVTAGSGYSPLNPDIIDLKKHPDYARVPWLYTTILPGDCVYIPAIYIHQVRAYGRSLSLTTLFTEEIIGHKLHFTSEGCSKNKLDEYHTMAEIDFHWTYEKGDETIDMGYMNVERLRHILINHLEDSRKTEWKFKDFARFYLEFSHGDAQNHPEEVWRDILGHKSKDKMTEKTVQAYTRQQLKLLARSLDPPHGPKTDGLQKVTVLPGDDKNDNDLNAEARTEFERRSKEGDTEEDDGEDGEEDGEEDGDDEETEQVSAPDIVYDEEQNKEEESEPKKVLSQEKHEERAFPASHEEL